MFSIRTAVENDAGTLLALDPVASQSVERREFICSSVTAGNCFVAESGTGQIIGYGIFDYTFYRSGFVALLYVHGDFRRRGIGAALLRHMENLCRTPKLFTSTNLSNIPMQSLLAREGFVSSGVIHNLDEGDPEMVYFKKPCNQKIQ